MPRTASAFVLSCTADLARRTGAGGGAGGDVVAGSTFPATPSNPAADKKGARGGEGGEGANAVGGTNPPSPENPPRLDMLPPNAYGPGAPCAVAGNTVGTVTCAGGDGGPGVIQLHVTDLSNIKVPSGTTRLSQLIQPNPIGSTPLSADVPTSWNRLVPIF